MSVSRFMRQEHEHEPAHAVAPALAGRLKPHD